MRTTCDNNEPARTLIRAQNILPFTMRLGTAAQGPEDRKAAGLRLRGCAPDGWLCAAHCGPLLSGGDSGAMIAAASPTLRECDRTILKHLRGVACVVDESSFLMHTTCERFYFVTALTSWRVSSTGAVNSKVARRTSFGNL